jgi:hypothetical protein
VTDDTLVLPHLTLPRRRSSAHPCRQPRQQIDKESVMKVNNEPAVIVGLIQAGLALAVSFGLSLTVEQLGAIVAVVAAVSAVFLRQRVSPVNTGSVLATPSPMGPTLQPAELQEA